MSKQNIADMTLAADGGTFTDGAGHSHFIEGYGASENSSLDLDPRIDLTKPIWSQSEQLRVQDEADESATAILEVLKPHLTKDDDPALWGCVL